MKIAFANLYSSLDPLLFRERNAPIGDDLLLPFMYVKDEADRRGHTVSAINLAEPDPDAIVFLDFPDPTSPAYCMLRGAQARKYLVTFENKLIRPQNFRDWGLFHKVMTWNDDLVAWNPDRCVKINYAQAFSVTMPDPAPRADFACLVASNKHNSSIESLYPERVRAIRFFERYGNGDDLHVYGPGWEGIVAPRMYRGTIAPGLKRKTMERYRFAIVYENAREPGYITEKLFDAMIAGCVPVYLGAPNVERWVPRECYVDATRFIGGGIALGGGGLVPTIDYPALAGHLAGMSIAEWRRYRRAAFEWMTGPESAPFSCETFAKTLLDTVESGERLTK